MSQAAQQREQKLLEKNAQKQEQKRLLQEVYAQEGLKKPPLKENRSIAKAVLAAVVALSILVIAPLKMNAKRNDVIETLKPASESQESVYKYIKAAARDSQTMLENIPAGTVPEKTLSDLENCIAEITSAGVDADRLTELNAQLVALTKQAYSAAIDRVTDEKAKANIEAFYQSVVFHKQRQIDNQAYWEEAASYNSARESFPGSLLGAVYSIDKVPAK
ncbi:MAG: hypothetical protein IJU28_09360 [Clostridia bacterium]|nr:hypothetical protein [Clostridia bacterium]